MTLIANLPKARGRGTRKLERITATGPASSQSVDAGTAADVAVPFTSGLSNVEDVVTKKITGTPTNLLLAQATHGANSVTLRAVNPTAGSIGIAANSLTLELLVVGY